MFKLGECIQSRTDNKRLTEIVRESFLLYQLSGVVELTMSRKTCKGPRALS